jgi:hypothetical protein
MLNFVYTDGERRVDPLTVSVDDRAMFESMERGMRRRAEHLECPRHHNLGKITIALRVGDNRHGWDILESCCSDFKTLVRPQIIPWWDFPKRYDVTRADKRVAWVYIIKEGDVVHRTGILVGTPPTLYTISVFEPGVSDEQIIDRLLQMAKISKEGTNYTLKKPD